MGFPIYKASPSGRFTIMDDLIKNVRDMPGPDYYYLRDSDITAFSSNIQQQKYVQYVNSKKKKFGVPWIAPRYIDDLGIPNDASGEEFSLPNIETTVGTDN